MHIGYFNRFLMAIAKGEKTPFAQPQPADKADKETARNYLIETLGYSLKPLERVTKQDLNKQRPVITGLEYNGAELILRAYLHTAHHRGQAEVYLRVKGVPPPELLF
jgi:uncharacterized damage-inducible protein DinB